jgi:hypothetical protein
MKIIRSEAGETKSEFKMTFSAENCIHQKKKKKKKTSVVFFFVKKKARSLFNKTKMVSIENYSHLNKIPQFLKNENIFHLFVDLLILFRTK